MRAIRGWIWIMLGAGCLVGSLGTLLLPGHLGGVIAGAMAVAFGSYERRLARTRDKK